MASPHRVNRVRQSLLRDFSDIVRKLKDPRTACASVVDAEISQDLRHAKLYYSVLGSEQDKVDAADSLRNATGFIRRELAQRLRLRYTPEVAVVYDDTSERAARVSALIDSIEPRKDNLEDRDEDSPGDDPGDDDSRDEEDD